MDGKHTISDNLITAIANKLRTYATQNNLIPTSIDTDSTTYNGTGYKSDYRINSSGNAVADDAFSSKQTVTGFIACSNGDRFLVDGIEKSSGYLSNCAYYDSNFNFISLIPATELTWDSSSPQKLASISVKTTGVAYMRLGGFWTETPASVIKNGTSETYKLPEMPSAIGGVYQKGYADGSAAATAILTGKTITENGIYNASSDNADGYDVVTVDVLPPQPPEDLSVENKQIKMVIELTGEETDPLECGISFIQTVANDIIIDWGDGSTEQSNAQINETIYNKTRYLHKYNKEGFYVITLTANNGELILPSNSYAGGSYLVNSGLSYFNMAAFGTRNSNYAQRLIGLYIGNAVELRDYSLFQLTNIKKINRMIKFPNVFEIPRFFSINAKNIIIPEGVEYILNSNIFAPTAYSIKFPSTLKAINSNAFTAYNTGGILVYDFSAIDLVDGALPFSIQTDSFNGVINDSVKMVFKTQEIAEIAKSTTNLSAYADFITYEGA